MTLARNVSIAAGDATLEGDLALPDDARGLVVFVHGSGSGRFSPRNRHVARILNRAGFATLLADLLTPEEELIDERSSALRFDIPMLAERTTYMIDWVKARADLAALPLGLFGASTGAAAAIIAAAARPQAIRAVVSRGGRIDLAGDALDACRAPLLAIVGSRDIPVIHLHQQAMQRLRCEHRYVEVPGATHLFEEPGTLDAVADLAAKWFERYARANLQFTSR